MERVHQNPDPCTGNCLDCGATREAIDDNLYPVCERLEGPHRLALIILKRESVLHESQTLWARRLLADAEEQVVGCARQLRRAEDDERQIKASFAFLKNAGQPTEESPFDWTALAHLRKIPGTY